MKNTVLASAKWKYVLVLMLVFTAGIVVVARAQCDPDDIICQSMP